MNPRADQIDSAEPGAITSLALTPHSARQLYVF
jgi:hypothetical protein